MTLTPEGLRRNAIDEATRRATQEISQMFVYEYFDLFKKRVWAVLAQNELPHPESSALICTVDPDGFVDWKIPQPSITEQPFTIDRHWLQTDRITISATTPDEAITKALSLPITPGTYLDDSLTCTIDTAITAVTRI